MKPDMPDNKMSRRKLLTWGAAGAVAVTGTLLSRGEAIGNNVMEHVYSQSTNPPGDTMDSKGGAAVGIRRIAKEVVQEYAQHIDAELAETASELELRAVNVRKLGLKGDGTDETASLLSALHYVADHHLTLLIPRGMTICVDTMTISNKQNFGIRCEGFIRRIDGSPTIGSILKLDSCSDVHIYEMNLDGNGFNNGCYEHIAYTVQQEQKHSLMLLNCNDIAIDRFHCLNPCGDGIYISNRSKHITIGIITGKADAQIGRNLISIINAQHIYIDYLYSDNIGHYDMPGGFDIEPNTSLETVRNVFVKCMNITGGGTNPCSVLGTNGGKVENIFIDTVHLTRTNVVQPSGEITSVYISGSNVRVGKLSVSNKTSFPISFITLNQQGLLPRGITILDAYGEGCYRGIQVGFGLNAVEDVFIKATIKNCKHDGVFIGTAKNVKFDLDVDSVGADRFMLNKPMGGGLCKNISITGNFTKRGTGLKAMIIGDVPANVVNWTIENVDFTGWGNNQRLYGGGFQGSVRKINCRNLTHLAALPAFEQFTQGDLIWNIGTDPAVSYWRRLTNGTGNVLNTDWKAY